MVEHDSFPKLIVLPSCISEQDDHIIEGMELAFNIEAGAVELPDVLSPKPTGDDSSVESI